MGGQAAAAQALFGRIEAIIDEPHDDPAFRAWADLARTQVTLTLRDDPGLAARYAQRSVATGEQIGDQLLVVLARFFAASALVDCGDLEAAEAAARPIVESAMSNIPFVASWAMQVLARVALARGDLGAVREWTARLRATGDRSLEIRATTLDARVSVAEGDRGGALRLLEPVIGSSIAPFDVAMASSLAADLVLDGGDVARARALVDGGLAVAARCGTMPTTRSHLQLVDARVAEREGRAWRPLRDAAIERIRAIADAMPTADLAAGWLRQPEHRGLGIVAPTHPTGAGRAVPSTQAAPDPMFDEESTVDATGFGVPTS
jgi:hypothetical protein